MILKTICELAYLRPLWTQGSVTAFHFKYQYIKYFSFLMTQVSSEIVSWVVVLKLPIKARTVHLPYDKAWEESLDPGKCGQPQSSSWILVAIPCGSPVSCDCVSFCPFNCLPIKLSVKVTLGGEVTILNEWGAVLLLPFLRYTIRNIFFLHRRELFLWLGFTVFQKSRDFKLHIYESHLFWWM